MVSRSRKPFVLAPLIAAVLWLSSSSAAPPPRDELLRLVPGNVGFCVVVQDLRGHIAQLESSPFATRLTASPAGQIFLNAPEVRKLVAFGEQITSSLRVPWQQLRDEILGDAVVLAYTPGPPGKPEAEQGLLLIHARQPQVLAKLFDRLNELRRASGEVSGLERREHRGQAYFRVRKKTSGDEYYLHRGAVFALSDQEAPLKAVIERDHSAPPADLVLPSLALRLRQLGVDRSLLVWWVNPRAFEPALREKRDRARGAEGLVLGTFGRYWAALDGAAAYLDLRNEVSVGVAVQARTAELPAAARAVIADVARPSAVLASIPDNAMFVAAGRVPWTSLVTAGGDFLPPEARQAIQGAVERSVGAVLGKDVLTEIARRIGPDWGVWLTPPDGTDKHWLPSLTAVLRLRPGDNGISVEQRLLDVLDFSAQMAVFAYGAQQRGSPQMRVIRQDGVEVRVIDGDNWPPGFRPAFAWKDGFLVLASSPEAVRRFKAPSIAAIRSLGETEIPLVRIALQGWAGYVRSFRKPLAASLAEAYQLTLAQADMRIDRWLEALDLFDTVEVTQRATPGGAALTLRLKTLPRRSGPDVKNPH